MEAPFSTLFSRPLEVKTAVVLPEPSIRLEHLNAALTRLRTTTITLSGTLTAEGVALFEALRKKEENVD